MLGTDDIGSLNSSPQIDLKQVLDGMLNKKQSPPNVKTEEMNISPSLKDDEGTSSVTTRPEPPTTFPAVLMPKKGAASGPAVWEELKDSNKISKIQRSNTAGLTKKTRYIQPIDVVIPYAGSEATFANEEYLFEDGVPTGMLARQISTAIRLQNCVGGISGAQETNGTRPIGVALVSTLSDDDHNKQVSINALQSNELKKAVKAAKKGRSSVDGPLRPVMTDEIGKVSLLTAGEGVTLATLRTGKVGGGKSVTAYALTSPRDSIDRQLNQGQFINQILESSERPIVMPLTMSVGGTSFDAYLAKNESSQQHYPPGAFQYVTTTPQDRLPRDVAVAASRKKLESVAALTCVDSGDSINAIPVALLDMSEEANAKFVETEQLRLVMENYSGLQPASTFDRSDVVVKLNEHSQALGKGCDEAKLFITDDGHVRGGERLKIQERDVYLTHAIHMNRGKVSRLATGQDNETHTESAFQHLTKRAFAQVYGRGVGEILLSDNPLHRQKIKMAQIVVFIPDDLEVGKRKQSLRRLQNTLTQGLDNVLANEYTLPQFTTIYRVPMTKDEHPIIAVRLMTHTKDIVDLLTADTPEFFERILTGISLQEKKDKKKGRTKMLENKIWHTEITSLESPRHRGIPFFKKWAAILKILVKRAYQKGWQPERKDAWGNGPRNY